MKEIHSILEKLLFFDQHKIRSALAVVVHIEGSSYRRIGARMLIGENGEWVGGISGGCLEGDAMRRAQKAIYKNSASITTYDTSDSDDYQIGVGLGCNGIISVLFLPVTSTQGKKSIEILRQIEENASESRVLITVVKGSKSEPDLHFGDVFLSVDFPFEQLNSTYRQDKEWTFDNQKSRNVYYSEDGLQLLYEYIPSRKRILIVGDQYDLYPLLHLVRQMGWHITVLSNKKRMTKEMHQYADVVLEKGSVINDLSEVHILLMSHDFKTDKNHLKNYRSSDAASIGLLGPKVRSEKMISELEEEGYDFSNGSPEIIYPLGLDIGANNPEEIAVSIVAGILALSNHRPGTFLSRLEGPMHERISIAER